MLGAQPGNRAVVSKVGLVDTPFTGLGVSPLLPYNVLHSSSQVSEPYRLLLNP
jgi:hypothetical protein